MIAQDIEIRPYGHGTFQIVAFDKFSPEGIGIAVNKDELRKLRDKIDKILN